MAGIGEAASIISLVSLSVKLFDGCVKGFVLLSAAHEFGNRGDTLRCQLEWEHYHLNDWATTVGLFRDPPELNVPYPPVVQRTLSNLEQLLTNATKLNQDYGLDVLITDEDIRDVQVPKRLFGRMLDKNKPQFLSDTAKVYSRRNSAWKKLKWASVDAEKFRLLLKDVRYFNKQLQGLLHHMDQKQKCREDNALMRSIVSQTSDKTLLNVMAEPLSTVDAAIAASAWLKQQGLLLELVGPPAHHSSASSSQTTLALPVTPSSRKHAPAGRSSQLRCNPDLLSGCEGHTSLVVSREIAHYDGKSIILEWKDVNSASESKLKYRIAKVAALLAEMKDPAFHSLACLGYLKANRSGRYAYLFDFPFAVVSEGSMRSLQDFLACQSQRPSLNRRIAIAISLAETVLQLHTSGWLHKCIRPENVLFFKSGLDEWESSDDFPPAYLGGYEYARADNPLEVTEAPSAQRHPQLYRHPLSIGQGRVSFSKSFDLYSLGCVLLELGFWTPLQAILLRYLRRKPDTDAIFGENAVPISPLTPQSDTEYYSMVGEKQRLLRETGPGTIYAGLEYRMGMVYSQIAMKCLHVTSVSTGNDDDEFDGTLDVQHECLAKLKALAAAI